MTIPIHEDSQQDLMALAPEAELPQHLDSDLLDTPALLIDLDVLDGNIASMADLAARRGMLLRPHAKSHKSAHIARMQLAAGATGLCLSTVGEAEVMWSNGFHDLLLAYPIIGEAKLRRLRPVADAGILTLVADSIEVAEGYSRLATAVGRPISVLIEIDSGMHRVGKTPDQAGPLAADVDRLPGLHVRGILTHAGQAHQAPDQQAIEKVARDEVRAMQRARYALERHGLQVSVVSAGSTITTPYLSADDGITEVRPGTYVFNDLRTLSRYACRPDQLALSMLATVVSRGPGRATLNAGSKSITTAHSEQHGYGHVVNRAGSGFGLLSEEHAVLDLAPEDEDLHVGQRVRILPIHACVWMDLQGEVYGTRRGQLVQRIRVEAMRRSR